MDTETPNDGSKRDPLTPHFTFRGHMHTTIDPILLIEIFRLRYEIYCLECRFLDPLNFKTALR